MYYSEIRSDLRSNLAYHMKQWRKFNRASKGPHQFDFQMYWAQRDAAAEMGRIHGMLSTTRYISNDLANELSSVWHRYFTKYSGYATYDKTRHAKTIGR